MLALVYEGPGRLALAHRADPNIQEPGDAVVTVTRAGVCGLDVALWRGRIPGTRLGAVFGHELCGVVESVGSAVTTVRQGDRVVVCPTLACGACEPCARGRTAACERSNPRNPELAAMLGGAQERGGLDGGHAQRVRVPFADMNLVPVPAGLDDEDAVLVAGPFAAGWTAAEDAGVGRDDVVVVFGAGAVGLCALKAASLMGARRLIVVDDDTERLERARAWVGAEPIDYALTPDVAGKLRELCASRGPDACIVAASGGTGSGLSRLAARVLGGDAGETSAVAWAMQTVRAGGTVAVLGGPAFPWGLLPLGDALDRGVSLRFVRPHVHTKLAGLLALVRDGGVDLRPLVTHRMGLDQGAEAYRIAAEHLDGCVRCLLLPQLE